QFKAALGYVRDLYAMGVYFPDPASLSTGNINQNLVSGKFGIANTGWFGYRDQRWDPGMKLNPPVKFRTLPPFSHDGRKPIWHQYQGFVGMTAVKKGSPERIKELLRILDFM